MFEIPKKSNSDHSTDKSRDAAAEPSSTDDLYRGVLVLPASLYTAQTLCLLTVYELLAWEQKPSTTARNFARAGGSTDQDPKLISPQGERFRQLTLQMLQELGVHKPTYPLLTPVPSQAFIEGSIEKECLRSVFATIEGQFGNHELNVDLTEEFSGLYTYWIVCEKFTIKVRASYEEVVGEDIIVEEILMTKSHRITLLPKVASRPQEAHSRQQMPPLYLNSRVR